MTTKLIDAIPADADCAAIITDLIRDAAAEIASSHEYFRDRFDMISDYDDYIPAAALILDLATHAFFAHIYDSPRETLAELLDDIDFINALATIDFSSTIHNFFDDDAIFDAADAMNFN